MKAAVYSLENLKNRHIQQLAKDGVEEEYWDGAVAQKIISTHPVNLYSPNPSVTTGLGILTLVIVLAISGLLFLILHISNSISPLLITIALGCYLALEYMTGKKNHFRSGVDNVLMILAATFFITAIKLELNGSTADTIVAFSLLIISTYFSIRFVSDLAILTACGSLLIFTFNFYSTLNERTIYSFPFVLIAVSAILILFANKMLSRKKYSVYNDSYLLIKLIGLLSLYCSGNYFMVDQLTDNYYLMKGHSALTASWFFWSWTFLIPAVYIALGIRWKDMIFLRIGAFLLLASVITFKSYYNIMAVEVAMIIGGFILLMTSFYLMKILTNKRHGFVYKSNEKTNRYSDLEALVISQALHSPSAPEPETKFEGGSFGGAGAGSSY